jgi:hypothetical protein
MPGCSRNCLRTSSIIANAEPGDHGGRRTGMACTLYLADRSRVGTREKLGEQSDLGVDVRSLREDAADNSSDYNNRGDHAFPPVLVDAMSFFLIVPIIICCSFENAQENGVSVSVWWRERLPLIGTLSRFANHSRCESFAFINCIPEE